MKKLFFAVLMGSLVGTQAFAVTFNCEVKQLNRGGCSNRGNSAMCLDDIRYLSVTEQTEATGGIIPEPAGEGGGVISLTGKPRSWDGREVGEAVDVLKNNLKPSRNLSTPKAVIPVTTVVSSFSFENGEKALKCSATLSAINQLGKIIATNKVEKTDAECAQIKVEFGFVDEEVKKAIRTANEFEGYAHDTGRVGLICTRIK